MDVLEETGDLSVPPHVERGAVAGGLPELAGLLAESAPDRLALVVAMGVDVALVEKPGDVTEAARAAFASEKPFLLELPIAPP